ncbi:MAG: hypothetical protein LBB29_02150 [Holosporaceae bacterium]|jgi:hypothetical protein|nr:hypothetical protein [Holosporaceae bacterium]
MFEAVENFEKNSKEGVKNVLMLVFPQIFGSQNSVTVTSHSHHHRLSSR